VFSGGSVVEVKQLMFFTTDFSIIIKPLDSILCRSSISVPEPGSVYDAAVAGIQWVPATASGAQADVHIPEGHLAAVCTET